MYELVPHEKNFALKVEELLSNITQPEYRQVIVEVYVCMYVYMYVCMYVCIHN